MSEWVSEVSGCVSECVCERAHDCFSDAVYLCACE